MSFTLPQYHAPDFREERFQNAPDAVLCPAPRDGVAPENYHATSIYPEYFKVGGQWLLAEESRMDCVAALRDGKIAVVEFRNLKAGEPVVVGRTEDASEGIYVYPDGFGEEKGEAETFAFPANGSVTLDIRVKFVGGNVVGVQRMESFAVADAASEVTL